MNKKVQIIIPVHNRLTHTEQTIDSLLRNTPPNAYELFVINDGSDEKTSKYLFSLAQRGFISILLTNEVAIGPGAARNMIIQTITDHNLRGEFLYSSDNDVYFKAGWIEKILEIYKKANETIANNKLRLLGASCHPFLQNNTRLSFQDESHSVGIRDAVSGYSQMMTWETWDKFGPFDEGSRGLEHKTGRSEDWALCQKIINAGFLVGSVEPELVVPCGKTDTYGRPAVGQETFKDVEGVMVA